MLDDAIGCALGCPHMLSLQGLMINVCALILYLLAPNRPVCSAGSVVRRGVGAYSYCTNIHVIILLIVGMILPELSAR